MSDPNDIINNYKVKKEEDEGFTPTPGSYMDRVEKAGGIEAYDEKKRKAQEELFEQMNAIPEQKWKKMLDSVISLETIVDKGGFDSSLISGWTEEIGDTFKTELEYALAPLKNELMAAINTALEPLMPLIQDVTIGIAETIKLGFAAWEAIIFGKWDEFFDKFSTLTKDWKWLRQIKTDTEYMKSILQAGYDEAKVKEWTGMSYAELAEQATEGGVYSGQFDLSPEDLEKLMNMNLDLGDFSG